MKYDFGGYATRNDLTCSDGRVIKKDAFKAQNGQTVPLVWNHNHDDVNDVLGLAHLENRKDGVYAYCEFNDTDNGKTAKELVQHGDVKSLSIFANQLMQKGSDVIHGLIREVSLVLAGANPGAFIDDVIAHGEDGSGIIACYDEGVTVFMHSDDKPDDEEKTKDSEDKKKEKSEDDETVEDVLATLTEKQQTAVYAMIGAMTGEDPENNNDDSDDNEGGKEEMKHNVFENGAQAQDNTLSHADQVAILETAKMRTVGTFKNALQMYAEENALQHDATSSGVATGDLSKLFPEYAEVRPGAPELITNDQGWISTVISKVHKSPMSRIRTTQADIRNIDTLKAHGYQKGKQKKLAGNFNLVRRTTDPQTIYVKNAFVLSSKESASVYTSKSKEYTFKPTDFNNASLESRFSSFIKLEKDETILWSQINRVITTNDYNVKQENQNLQSGVIELKESKEKTLLDDFDIQEVPIKKETSNSKKKNTIKYEKITLEDILNDDEF